jgi:hypothetical protein
VRAYGDASRGEHVDDVSRGLLRGAKVDGILAAVSEVAVTVAPGVREGHTAEAAKRVKGGDVRQLTR